MRAHFGVNRGQNSFIIKRKCLFADEVKIGAYPAEEGKTARKPGFEGNSMRREQMSLYPKIPAVGGRQRAQLTTSGSGRQ